MKTILLFLGLFLISSFCFSQQTTFSYDQAGNRVARRVFNLWSSAQHFSSDLEEEKEEKYSNTLLTRKVTVYPNPTSGTLNLTISNGEEEGVSNIRIYDNSGKLLKELEALGNTSVSVDLSPYPAGYYLIDFNQGESKSFYKIIKH